MTAGYREAPEEATRRKREWLALAVAVPAALTLIIGLSYFQDAFVARTGLPHFAYDLIRYTLGFFLLAKVTRWLEHPRQRGPKVR